MPYVQPEITCNLQWRNQTRQMAFAKQGDYNSRKIALLLYNGSNRFTWTDSAYTAEFAYKRPDGAGRAYSQIDGNSAISLNAAAGAVTVLLEPEVLAVAGMVQCELRLLTEGSRIATFTFGYFVEAAVVDDSTPSPSPTPTPTPTCAKTKFFGFDSMAAYESFVAENPTTLGEGDIVVITSTSSGNTLHTFYVLITGNNGLELDSRHVITVGSGSGTAATLPGLGSGYASSSNTASTVARTASLTGFTLTTGGSVKVLFTTAVNATNPTLNVGGTGAKAIWYKGAAVTSGTIKAGDLVTLVYDGTRYRISSIDRDLTDLSGYLQNNSDTLAKIGCGYCVCSSLDEVTQKTATLANYVLRTGGLVAVKFSYPVVGSSNTLNINNSADVPLYRNGSALTTGVISAGDIGLFVFDGTNYELLAVNKDMSSGGGAEVFAVTITTSSGGSTTKSAAELYAARQAGKIIQATIDGNEATLLQRVFSTEAVFYAIDTDSGRVLSEVTLNDSNDSTTVTAVSWPIGNANEPNITELTGATPTINPIADNTIYKAGALTSLTVGTWTNDRTFTLIFTSGSTPISLVWTNGHEPEWPSNFDGTPEANKRYEINVMNGYAVVGVWEVSGS